MDLPEYTQFLIKKGDSSSTHYAHKLQAILQSSSIEPNKRENNSKSMPLIIVGAVLVGYLLGKKRSNKFIHKIS